MSCVAVRRRAVLRAAGGAPLFGVADILDTSEIADLAERMRERLASRGETLADVVLIQGDSKETLRLFGEGYSVGRVRAALFNAAVSWSPLELD